MTRTFSKAYGLAGLPGRLRRGARADRRRAAGGARCRSASRPSRRPRRSPRWPPRTSCWSGSTRWSASATGCVAGLREAGWDVPDAQGNFVWFELGRPDRATSPRRPTRPASWSGPSPARAPGSRIGEPEANDRLLAVAARLPGQLTGSRASGQRQSALGGLGGAAVHRRGTTAARRGAMVATKYAAPSDEQRRGQAEAADEHAAEQPAERHQGRSRRRWTAS